MIIVHTPADGPVERFDIKTVRAGEATRISTLLAEKASWPQVKQLLSDDHPDAMRVVAFVMKCRDNPALRMADFDPLLVDLAVLLDREEVTSWGETAAAMTVAFDGSEDALRVELSVILDLAADQDHAREVIDRVVAGKFPPPLSEPTDESSPTPEESPS
ncbi:hypothetical protein [Streptomyces misionensis]|uniref:hypothetical protein n=1 Tax=Streptomyces misionensis TaxID=67331 RepID=UPI0036C12F7A